MIHLNRGDQSRDTVPNLPGPQAQFGGSRRVTETVMVSFQGQLCGLKPSDLKTEDQLHSPGSRDTQGISKVNCHPSRKRP